VTDFDINEGRSPREVSPGVFWVATCNVLNYKDRDLHSHLSAYLITGADKTLMVDTGNIMHRDSVLEQVRRVLGERPLDFLFPTHPETPHMGNLPTLLDAYPECVVVGDLRNYHLFYPQYASRFKTLQPGARIPLGGGREIVLLEATIKDLPNTLWAFDTESHVLFVADGFAYFHGHTAGECAMTASELPTLPEPDDAAFVPSATLFWPRFVDSSGHFERLERVMTEHDVRAIAPAHGTFITDPEAIMPVILEGMVRALIV
jgi:flavorubredoxin